MKIILANPRGFCAGVIRAINIVEKLLDLGFDPVYVRHEIVHSRAVVERLKKRGVLFVKELDEIPDNSVCVFSAHGVSKQVQDEAKRKRLRVYDATCPLVTKVHREVQNLSSNDIECILIGHRGHPEVEGTLGQYISKYAAIYLVEKLSDINYLKVNNPNRLAYSTQTTLSVDETDDIISALKQKYPGIRAPKKNDICYATQNRQNAVRQLASKVDMFLVVGSINSSNSNRLCELAKSYGVDSYLIDGPDHINLSWFENKKSCSITSGASAPEHLVQKVVNFLKQHFQNITVESFEGITEDIIFPFPKTLR